MVNIFIIAAGLPQPRI